MIIDRHHRTLARNQAKAFAEAAKAGQIPFKTWAAAERARTDRTYKLTTLSSSSWKVVPGSNYGWFYIMWAPGVLVLAGDAGDLTLQHGQAMATIEGALEWLPGSDASYRLSKSTSRKVLDRDATARYLAKEARQDVIDRRKYGWRTNGTPSLRQRIKRCIGAAPTVENIGAHIGDMMEHEVALWCRDDLEIDDYCGSESWAADDIRCLRLMQLWAELMWRQRAVGITAEELAA